jgi:hypothetical protein
MSPHLCAHGMNPKSCPTCYRLKPEVPKAVAVGNVVPLEEAKRRHEELLARASEQLAASQAAAAKRVKDSGATAVAGGNVLAPYSSANESAGSYDADGLWAPPDRRDVIDRAPRHPHADESNVKVLNPAPLIIKQF